MFSPLADVWVAAGDGILLLLLWLVRKGGSVADSAVNVTP